MSNPTARDAVHLYLSSLFGNAELAEGLANALDEAGFLITPGELDAVAKRQERERFERQIEWVVIPDYKAVDYGRELPINFDISEAAFCGDINDAPEFPEGYVTYTRTSSPWKRTNPSTAEEA
jgi:hypothetical protein